MPGSARASAAKTTPSSRENIAIGILLENCVGCRKRQSRVNGREQIRNKKRDGQLAIGFCLLPTAYCLLPSSIAYCAHHPASFPYARRGSASHESQRHSP